MGIASADPHPSRWKVGDFRGTPLVGFLSILEMPLPGECPFGKKSTKRSIAYSHTRPCRKKC